MIAVFLHWAVYLLTLGGLCAFAVNYTAWFSSYLFYVVLLLPIFSLVLSLWPYFALKLSFSAPMQIHRGDTADLNITVSANGCPYYLPLTLTVLQTDLSHPSSADASHTKAVRCQFAPYPIVTREKHSFFPYRIRAAGGLRIPIPTSHTTVIRTEIRGVSVCDFLGLFRLPIKRSRSGASVIDITVLPHADAPKGTLRMWDNSRSLLVPTQRPSEQYEIRTYRPGDALRAVHWKLTAKIDEILVRESVEPEHRVLAVALVRDRDPDQNDCIYDALDWMLRTLCTRDRTASVLVGWVGPSGETAMETLYDPSHLNDFYRHLLSEPQPDEIPEHAFAAVHKRADRGYYLDLDACRKADRPVTPTTAGNEPTDSIELL